MTDIAEGFVEQLKNLRQHRETNKSATRAADIRRGALRPEERARVLSKTGGRCHICGGQIGDSAWQADHVLAHSGGGTHAIDNYLPAHSLCNNYRWDYLAEEFQLILKLGVWVRTQIEKQTVIGRACVVAFAAHEQRRAKRTKRSSLPSVSPQENRNNG